MSHKRIQLLETGEMVHATISRSGRYVLYTYPTNLPKRIVLGDREDGSKQSLKCAHRLDSPLVRSFYRAASPESGKLVIPAHELMYAAGGSVRRLNLPDMANKQPLEFMGSEAHCLTESGDGRYLAIASSSGYTNACTHIEVWNLDRDTKPYRLFDLLPLAHGRVQSMCFNRTNMQLFASLTSGELYLIEPHKQDFSALHWERRPWPCYCIASQPGGGKSVAFGGESPFVWFVDSPYRVSYEYLPENSPLEMALGSTVFGASYAYVAGMPQANLGYLKTGVGSYVSHLKFVNDTELLVVGEGGCELWDLKEMRVIEDRQFSDKGRVLAVGADGKQAIVIRFIE